MATVTETPAETLPAFARELLELRLERGWRQDDLAAASGYDRALISRYEHGVRDPSRAAIDLLSHAVDDESGRLYLAAGMVPEWLHRLLRADRVNLDMLVELFSQIRKRCEAQEGTIHDWT
jgi:transcriptional regulator with XRE-family HTH domain